MATELGPPLTSQRYGDSLETCAAGRRDTLIVASLADAPSRSPDVVPRCDFEPTEQDRGRLANQGVHVESYDDLSVIKARIARNGESNLVGEEISLPGRELTRDHILKRLKTVLTNCSTDGVVIYYFGNGKRNTGDWCFQDGFITFRDIATLYLQNFRGRVLTISTDCSHSGSWVKACKEFLDEQGVQPCGHSAAKKGIFLKVYASCNTYEKASISCFALRGVLNDKNNSSIRYNTKDALQPTQHPCGYDFTLYRCKEDNPEEPCTYSPGYTWEKYSRSERIYLVKGTDKNRAAWYYVLVVDDVKTIDRFKEELKADTINLEDFGQILKSGYGKEPPDGVTQQIEETYSM